MLPEHATDKMLACVQGCKPGSLTNDRRDHSRVEQWGWSIHNIIIVVVWAARTHVCGSGQPYQAGCPQRALLHCSQGDVVMAGCVQRQPHRGQRVERTLCGWGVGSMSNELCAAARLCGSSCALSRAGPDADSQIQGQQQSVDAASNSTLCIY